MAHTKPTVAHLTPFDLKRSMRAVRAMFLKRGIRATVKRGIHGNMKIRGRTNFGGSLGFDPSDPTITEVLREFGLLRADETLRYMGVVAAPDEILVPEDLESTVRSIT